MRVRSDSVAIAVERGSSVRNRARRVTKLRRMVTLLLLLNRGAMLRRMCGLVAMGGMHTSGGSSTGLRSSIDRICTRILALQSLDLRQPLSPQLLAPGRVSNLGVLDSETDTACGSRADKWSDSRTITSQRAHLGTRCTMHDAQRINLRAVPCSAVGPTF